MKFAEVVAYEFNCLPAHRAIRKGGKGSSARIAVQNAIRAIFTDSALFHKQVKQFKIQIVLVRGTE